MASDTDLVPVTVFLPQRSATQLATIAVRRGSTAEGELARLVLHALSNAVIAGRIPDEDPAQLRPIDSLQILESIQMRTLQLDGASITDIAARFHLSELDARTHLQALADENPRSRKPHVVGNAAA